MQRQHFPVDHDIDRLIEIKFNAAHALVLGQRMLNMRAVVQSRQIANQPQPANRSPPDIFDQSVIDLSLGRDHHGAAGEFTVVKSQEQATAVVESSVALDSDWKGPAVETRQREKDRRQITQFSPPAETARTKCGDIRRKTDTQEVDEVKLARPVPQAQHIAGAATTGQERLDRVLNPTVAEVAQEGIAGSEWQERQCRAIAMERLGVQAVHNFVGSSVAADSDKFADTACIGLARNLCCFSGSPGCGDLDLNAARL